MMNIQVWRLRTLIPIAILVLLLLATMTQAQQGTQCFVEGATVAGGGYQLTSLVPHQAQDAAWQVNGAASGGGYRLQGVTQPPHVGSGCCCTYLPALLRSFP
jgi:hypothetical protein